MVYATMGLTVNNLNKLLVRHFEDQAVSGLKPNSDKTVTNPSLKAGVSGYTSSGALALMSQQHEVVHVVYCQSLCPVRGNTIVAHCASDG